MGLYVLMQVIDTVMWRKRVGEPETIIERRFAGWLHEVMVRWLVDSGTKCVMKA